ncbi:MAG TPA: methyltransferase domain-containing protein, partial [bacterium]|nr:methyltransferase domain-containing protein [bacterium]
LPFRDEHFDFVILKYVLEYLDQPELVVSQLRAILKRNQFVYVVVPKYYAFQDTIYRILGKTAELLRLGKQAHIAKFTFGTLCKLFYDNGFIMIDFYEADAGLSFLDKTSARRNLKKIILLFIYLIKKITGKNLLERNEMHFLFCKFE